MSREKTADLRGGQVGDGVRLWRMDWIGGTARCVVGLVHYRFRSVGSPHPTRALPGPPSPSGKALSTRYKLEMLYFLMIYGTAQSLPLGGRWPRSGRMRATFRKQSVVYQRSNALTIFIPVTPSTPSNTALQTKHTPAPPPSWRRQATHRIVKSRAGKKR